MADSDHAPDYAADNSLASRATVLGYLSAFSSSRADGYRAERAENVPSRPGFETGTEGLSGHSPVHCDFAADDLCLFGRVWDVLFQIYPSGRVRACCAFAVWVCRGDSPLHAISGVTEAGPLLTLVLLWQ